MFSLRWIDRIPLMQLLILALMMALMPAILPPYPEPHLLEKLKMLFSGTLVRPLDIFDLFLHGTPLTLLGVRLYRIWRRPE